MMIRNTTTITHSIHSSSSVPSVLSVVHTAIFIRLGPGTYGAGIVSSCIFVKAARCGSVQTMQRIWLRFLEVEW